MQSLKALGLAREMRTSRPGPLKRQEQGASQSAPVEGSGNVGCYQIISSKFLPILLLAQTGTWPRIQGRNERSSESQTTLPPGLLTSCCAFQRHDFNPHHPEMQMQDTTPQTRHAMQRRKQFKAKHVSQVSPAPPQKTTSDDGQPVCLFLNPIVPFGTPRSVPTAQHGRALLAPKGALGEIHLISGIRDPLRWGQ